MTEEEKKAIDILKDYKFDFECEGKYPYLRESITSILNLIEKQQKEIESLKSNHKELHNFTTSCLDTLKDFVHKDKIRERIKELESDTTNKFSFELSDADIRNIIVINLKELLERMSIYKCCSLCLEEDKHDGDDLIWSDGMQLCETCYKNYTKNDYNKKIMPLNAIKRYRRKINELQEELEESLKEKNND